MLRVARFRGGLSFGTFQATLRRHGTGAGALRYSLESPPVSLDGLRRLPAEVMRRQRWAQGMGSLVMVAWPWRGGSALARALLQGTLPPLAKGTITRTRMGFDLVVGPADGNNYYVLGAYERGTLGIMRRYLGAGDVFVDVGASVGQMSLYASDCVGSSGRVVAFEPHAERFASLAAAIMLNARANVVAYRLALSDRSSTAARLYVDRSSPSMVVVAGPEQAHQTVSAVRLDEVLQREGIGRVRMMKVDVEGLEAMVLRGAGALLIGPHAPIVCVEHSAHAADPHEPLRYLAEVNRYRFYSLSRTKDSESRLLPIRDLRRVRRNDNVFCFPPCVTA